MSPIGRIFSVLNLVLAALFLSWASMTLSSADSYRQQLDDAVAAAETAAEDAAAQLSTAQVSKNAAETRANNLGNAKATLETNNARLEQEKATLTAKNTGFEASVDRISLSLDQEMDNRNTAEAARTAAVEARHEAENAKTEALSAQEAADTQVADLEAEIAALKKKVNDRDKKIVALNSDLSQKDTELATIIDVTGVDAGSILAMPLINGVVIEALYDVEPGLVAINKGSADKVMRGFTFDIYDGADYKGRVRVENVRENTCTAIVTQPVDGQRIGQGDNAATRL